MGDSGHSPQDNTTSTVASHPSPQLYPARKVHPESNGHHLMLQLLQLNEKEKEPPFGVLPSPAKAPIRRETRILGLTKVQLSLLVLVIQNSTLVLMMRKSRLPREPGERMYIASTAVCLAELFKLVACLGVILFQKRTFSRFWHVVVKEIIREPGEILKLAIPSGLYALQNNLLYVALSNLEAATFQVTYQLKILSTAVFSVILLRRTLGLSKWCALVLLMIGVTLVQLQTVSHPEKPLADAANPEGTKDSPTHSAKQLLLVAQNPLIGLVAVITSCISSGFAGCYFEKILKSTDVSMWVRNIQLGISGFLFSMLAMVFYDGQEVLDGGFLQGYDSLTFAVVANQALGGLLVAMVVKYADNILKGFATSTSIIISGFISFYFFHFQPTLQFTGGALIVMLATYLYAISEKQGERFLRGTISLCQDSFLGSLRQELTRKMHRPKVLI